MDLYDAIQDEILDRQKYLESIAHLEEPKLKERIKHEIVERVGELEKVIKMLKK